MTRQLMLLAGIAAFAAPTKAQGVVAADAGTVVLAYAQCEWGEMERIRLIADSVMVPVGQQMVDQGHWLSYGIMFHDIGDEWNVVFVYTARSKESFFEGWQAYSDMLDHDHPGLYSWMMDRCRAHKENVYEAGPFTVPRLSARP